jgi:hypothetical protein
VVVADVAADVVVAVALAEDVAVAAASAAEVAGSDGLAFIQNSII